MGEFFDNSPAPAIERLARIEGECNFLSLLAGCEIGRDTTQDMAALSFSRALGGLPEVLEAYVAQSDVYRRPLMSMMFAAIKAELRPKEADYPWIRGAIADAFLLVQKGSCLPTKARAKAFKVDNYVYGIMRGVAYSTLWQHVDRSERAWVSARFKDGHHPKTVP